VPGRDVSVDAVTRRRGNSGRILRWTAAALALLGIGIAVGSRIGSRSDTTVPQVSKTVPSEAISHRRSSRPAPASLRPTRASAVAAAARSITAFDGAVLLQPQRLEGVVAGIASSESRAQLVTAFDAAGAQTRAKLGAETVPPPVIVLRSVPVGYRIERFSPNSATVAVWYVGIVGSGATVEPQQSWRTQIVSLVAEDGAWKVNSFQSAAGPTPPLSTAEAPTSPGELFASIPRFQEFTSAEP
jgi:hypothetical protein